ncbi:MAG: acyl-CoA thioesterase [Planctomycetes bacterium]|nr:acyl-CoA thioesterase [Planctomycetota bacterium]
MAPDPFRFTAAVPLRWVDVDVAGVVNHAVYWSLIEQARFDYFAQLKLVEGDIPPFLLGEATIRYERPARRGDALAVAVRTARLGGKSFEMQYEVRREAAGEVRLGASGASERLAVAKALLVWVDAKLASCEIPAAARRAIAAFEGIGERG